MAKFQVKCEELLKILPELKCHDCKNVPGPSAEKKNRYYCTNVNESHALCEKHKVKCPCGSLVGKNPSPLIAKLLQDLPWMCQNYENGCREIKMDAEELEYHQGKCIFRLVFCPENYCCNEEKVMFKDINDHLVKVHKNDFETSMLKGEKNKWAAYKKFAVSDFDSTTLLYFPPIKITSTDGDAFYEVGYIKNKAFYFIIYLMGSSDEAKKFSCKISVSNKDGEEFTYTGKIHTFDEKYEDIIASESLFKIGNNAIKKSLDEKKRLCFELTIRNLKEEAKDDDEESGVTGGE